MEIIKGKNKTTYREMIWINGRQIKSPSFARKTDAKNWLSKMQAKKLDGIIVDNENNFTAKKKLCDYAQDWLLKSKHRLAPKTYNSYEHRLRIHILSRFGDLDLKQIKTKHGEELVRVLLANGHNPSGVNIIMMVFKSIMIAAKKDRFIQFNPFEGEKKLKTNPLTDVFWEKMEIMQFLRANLQDVYYHLYVVALNTGMRKGELGGLCWDRVDFVNGLITVSRSYDRYGLKETTKTNLRRHVPINDLALASLKELMKQQRSLTYVFTGKDGGPVDVSHFDREFKRAQKRAGFDRLIRFHDLRHTFASQYMMSGRSLYDLQKILGHSKMEMTLRYAHFSPDHLKSAIAGFNLGLDEENKSYPKSTQNAELVS